MLLSFFNLDRWIGELIQEQNFSYNDRAANIISHCFIKEFLDKLSIQNLDTTTYLKNVTLSDTCTCATQSLTGCVREVQV
jgi:hypothetical protein